MKRLIQSKKLIYTQILEKVSSPHKEIISELLKSEVEQEVEKIQTFQNDSDRSNLNINYILQNFPNCIYKGTGYRAIELDSSNLDKDNLEQSIRDNIYYNELESWSKSKSFVDNLNYSLNIMIKRVKNPVIIRLKADIEGLDINKFFDEVKKQYNIKVWTSFTKEEEVISPTPANYIIYNLEEIKKKINKKKTSFWG